VAIQFNQQYQLVLVPSEAAAASGLKPVLLLTWHSNADVRASLP
jgi:hypothetical protein